MLYCAIEEGFGYTLQEKVGRLKASHPRLYVTDRVPENPGQFDFVFIDSVTKAGLEIEDMDALRKAHPRTSFIFIYHTTKEGCFKGSNTHAHERWTLSFRLRTVGPGGMGGLGWAVRWRCEGFQNSVSDKNTTLTQKSEHTRLTHSY